MAYAPIAKILPQYENFPDYWMKAYQQGTTTPLSMATDATGTTTAAKFQLNTAGFPITAGGALVIPFIDGDYDIWLFTTAAEADANDTTNAIQMADNINADPLASNAEEVGTLAELIALDFSAASNSVYVRGRATNGDGYEDTFIRQSGDQSANVTADPLQGIWVAPASDLTGASGAWKRAGVDYINPKWFGHSTSKTASENAAAMQAALDYSVSTPLKIYETIVEGGIYEQDLVYIPVGAKLRGSGNLEDADKAPTRFKQNTANSDLFRFNSITSGSFFYWHGQLSDFAILGVTTNTLGWGIRFVDDAANNVNPTDQSVIQRIVIREMPQGGIYLPSGAFPLVIGPAKFLWNNGPGIRCDRVTQFQGVHFKDISADGNTDGAIYLKDMSINDNFLITNLKSEMRVNPNYSGTEEQNYAIQCEDCDQTPIQIAGANHISSVPDGGAFKKPGHLVNLITSTNSVPRITWDGVSIRVRSTDTGTDPNIIGGSTISYVYEPGYTFDYGVPAGVYNTDVPMFRSRLILHRDTVTAGTTISCLNRNIMLLDYAAPTTINTIVDGVEGAVFVLAFNNSNVTIQDSASILLSNRTNFNPGAGAILVLIHNGGVWKEISRSINLATVYTETNVTTDRSFDANTVVIAELADVVGTLIGDLRSRGIIS